MVSLGQIIVANVTYYAKQRSSGCVPVDSANARMPPRSRIISWTPSKWHRQNGETPCWVCGETRLVWPLLGVS